MSTRRRFLSHLLILPFVPALARASAVEEFERFKRQQAGDFLEFQSQWERYRSAYLNAWQGYRSQLMRVWDRPEMAGRKVWTEHSADMKVRRTLDFSANEVRLSFAADQAANLSPQRIRLEFERLMSATLNDAWQNDPVLRQLDAQRPGGGSASLSGVPAEAWTDMLARQTRSTENSAHGPVVTITIPLPGTALPQRSQAYLPLVQQYARKWQVEPALVLAIMETESSFNPMARSQVPAFGLMQIVPSSAGRDASKLVYGSERLLTASQLCTPATNIEMGCAYLSLLDSRYLSAVENPQSRLYCVIAAYNTGAGNVARAFSGNTSVDAAAKRINRMTPQQVYAHLRSQLPYAETRNYVQKVTKALQTYRA